MPITKGGYQPRREWLLLQEERENAQAKGHLASKEAWTRATHPLVPLVPGTLVSVQKQGGPHNNNWVHLSLVVECMPNSQFKMKLDGSGRVILRN